MNLLNTAVSDNEARFDPNELFFSITDNRGVILSGNDVFVRISGYTRSELIGKPHNLIRHPDMPRIIFKTLWDTILSGRPLVAYVKNRTKNGEYYWVLAAVFPLNERFVSIRIKPSTPLFDSVKALYFRLLMAETTGGMSQSADMLHTQLTELGYSGYDGFMSDILLQELRKRKGSTANLNITLPAHLRPAYELCSQMMEEYAHWFEKIDFFIHTNQSFDEKRESLRQQARDIVFLSLNASVSSYKVENGGETFGILSQSIRSVAKMNDTLISRIHTLIVSLSDQLNAIVFSVSSIRLQLETLLYFIREISHNEEDIHLGIENIDDLITLALETAAGFQTLQTSMDQVMDESIVLLDQLDQQVMYLGYVQIYGLIESARSEEERMRFGVIFEQLKTLIAQMSEGIVTMQKMGKEFVCENRLLMKRSAMALTLSNRLRNEVETLKSTKGHP